MSRKKWYLIGKRRREFGGWGKVSYPKSERFCNVILLTYSRALSESRILTKLKFNLQNQIWKKAIENFKKRRTLIIRNVNFFFTTIKMMLEQNLNCLYYWPIFSKQSNNINFINFWQIFLLLSACYCYSKDTLLKWLISNFLYLAEDIQMF